MRKTRLKLVKLVKLVLAGAGFLCIALLVLTTDETARAQTAPAPGVRPPSSIRLLAGRKIFAQRCVPCHGLTGLGDGPRASSLPIRPANLQRSRLSNEQKRQIILRGGVGVGRSAYMPPWGQELKPEQVADLILYLRAININ